MKNILEQIYEPLFSDTSYGFRPGRSQITALRNIRKNFGGVIWFIEGDITQYFDTVNHETLMNLLQEKIRDTKFLRLIREGLKARILLPDGKLICPETGVPQGGILSPLLSNIYLHQLDK